MPLPEFEHAMLLLQAAQIDQLLRFTELDWVEEFCVYARCRGAAVTDL